MCTGCPHLAHLLHVLQYRRAPITTAVRDRAERTGKIIWRFSAGIEHPINLQRTKAGEDSVFTPGSDHENSLSERRTLRGLRQKFDYIPFQRSTDSCYKDISRFCSEQSGCPFNSRRDRYSSIRENVEGGVTQHFCIQAVGLQDDHRTNMRYS